MKFLGTKEIQMSRIKAPGDIKKRLSEDRVRELAQNIQELGGTIADIVVRKQDMRLLAGRDRYAALVLNKAKKATVKLVECDEKEAKRLERSENVYRRHDPGERSRLMAELVDKVQDELVEKNPELKPRGKSGGALTARGRARKIVAKKLGVTPETVRVAEYRAQKEKATQEAAEGKTDSLLAFGMQVDDEFRSQVAAMQKNIDDASQAASKALGIMTRTLNTLPFPEAQGQAIQAILKDAGNMIRRWRPAAICPHCKCIAVLQEKCAGCATKGWVCEAQLQGVPPALLRDENPVVRQGDVLIPATEFFRPEAAYVGMVPELQEDEQDMFG